MDWSGELDDYSADFLTFREDMDATPLLKVSPTTSASARTGASSLRAGLRYRVGDREEVFEAGDAFYLPPGHIPMQNDPGNEFVQFSPTKEPRETHTVMRANLEAMQAG